MRYFVTVAMAIVAASNLYLGIDALIKKSDEAPTYFAIALLLTILAICSAINSLRIKDDKKT